MSRARRERGGRGGGQDQDTTAYKEGKVGHLRGTSVVGVCF